MSNRLKCNGWKKVLWPQKSGALRQAYFSCFVDLILEIQTKFSAHYLDNDSLRLCLFNHPDLGVRLTSVSREQSCSGSVQFVSKPVRPSCGQSSILPPCLSLMQSPLRTLMRTCPGRLCSLIHFNALNSENLLFLNII